MKTRWLRVIYVIILLSSIAVPASAVITNITANRDAEVKEDFPTTNYGTATTMSIGWDLGSSNNERYVLLGFDTSSIPAGSTINSATVYIYQSSTGSAVSFYVDVVAKDSAWVEGTATWMTGGSPTGTNHIYNAFIASGTTTGWKSFSTTNIFRGWYNSTLPNNGIELWNNSGDLSSAGKHTFNSKENGANQPYISVDYTPPPTYIPPVPTIGSVTTGNFWKNITWSAGSGNVTNSYNISRNGTWTNGTTTLFKNSTTSAHGWINDTIYAWNSSSGGTLSTSALTNNTQIPNNPVTISNISSSYSISVGQTLTIYPTSSDADGDTPTFSTTASKGTFYTNNGTLLWTTQAGDNGTYNWQINVTDGYGSTATKQFSVSVNSSTPGTPTSLTPSTSNFWVNYTWVAGANTDTFNVSYNGTWINGSSTASIQKQVGAHGWGNISVYGWNNTGMILSSTAASSNTQVPNNAISISNVSSSYSLSEGQTLYIDANYTDADSDTGTFLDNATQWNVNTGTGVVSWVTADGDQGTYNWQINVTDGYGSISTQAFTVTVGDSTPTVPTNLAATTGNFWINWTWDASAHTDDYNILINETDIGSHTTNLYYYNTYSTHATRNISIRSHNHSLNSYSAWTNLTTTIPNNAVTISNISSAYTAQEGVLLSIYPTSLDADSDTPTYNTTATKGTFYTNNGTLLWTPTSGENGTYNWQINVTDGYGSTDYIQFSVSVNSSTPGMPGNLAATTGNFWINYTWTAGVNTDRFNVSQNDTWTNGTTAIFINTSLNPHGWSNITIFGYNNTVNILGNSTSMNTQVPDNSPVINGNGSISSSSFTTSDTATITLNNITDADNDSTNTLKAGITLLGGNEVNYTMTTIDNSTWTYSYSTLTTGTYTITNFYASNSYGSTSKAVTIQFTVTSPSSGGSSSGGGGGGGGTTIIIKETENATAATPLLTLKNITEGATEPELQEIADCLTQGLLMENKCSAYNYGVVVEAMNWWVFFGAFFAAFGVVVIRGIYQDKAREWFTEPLLYGTTTTLILMVLVSVGFNLYILNYITGSPKYAWTFASTALWGGIVAFMWDEYYYGKKKYKVMDFRE